MVKDVGSATRVKIENALFVWKNQNFTAKK